MGTAVAPDAILRELQDLWVTLAKPDGEGRTAVLRACTMTLITVTGESDDFSALGETLAALMPAHPARSILVKLHRGAARGLSSRVYSQCWTPFGERRQICCEQIEIAASESELADVATLLPPLAAPDLPVVVWGRDARAIALPGFAALASVGCKAIVDSDAHSDPASVLRRLEAPPAGVQPADLAWTRLTRWREVLARLFDNREHQARLREISRVRVGCASPLPAAALYLGAWAADCLEAAGADAAVSFETAPDPPPGGVASIALSGDGPGAFAIEIRASGDVLSTHVDGMSQCALLPRPTEYLLLREELAILRVDPVYRKTLPTALRLAISSGTR